MKRTLVGLIVGGVLLGMPSIGVADAQVDSAERTAFNARQVSIDTGVSLMNSVRSAVLASYMANDNTWPASTNALVAVGFTNTVTSQWGNVVTGAVSGGGNSYTLNLTAPLPEVAVTIAGKLGGVATGNIISVNIPVPATASIMNNGLMRVAVNGQPELNRMQTDLDLGNFDLLNIKSLDAATINGSSANLGTVSITNSLTVDSASSFKSDVTVDTNLTVANKIKTKDIEAEQITTDALITDGATINNTLNAKDIVVSSSITAPMIIATDIESDNATINGTLTASVGNIDQLNATNADIDTATIDNLVSKQLTANEANITGGLKVGGPAEFASDALFNGNVSVNGNLTVAQIATLNEIKEGGVFLRDKYLGIDATAKDSLSLGGVEASKYARLDIANTFEGDATFKKNLAVTGLINASEVSTDKATISTLNATNTYIDGLLDVQGVATFNGNTIFKKDVQVDAAITAENIYATSSISEGGILLENKYLGIGDNAANADRLSGYQYTDFARLSEENTFQQTARFNGAIIGTDISANELQVSGQTTLTSLKVNANATIRGSIYASSRIYANRGVTVNGGPLYVNSRYDVNVGNISLKNLATRVQALENNGGNKPPPPPPPPPSKSWKTIYNSTSGTRSISTGGVYEKFQMKYSYTANGRNYSSTFSGDYGRSFVISASVTKSQLCQGGSGPSKTATARISTTIDGSFSISSSATGSAYLPAQARCNVLSVQSKITNAKITQFKVYR